MLLVSLEIIRGNYLRFSLNLRPCRIWLDSCCHRDNFNPLFCKFQITGGWNLEWRNPSEVRGLFSIQQPYPWIELWWEFWFGSGLLLGKAYILLASEVSVLERLPFHSSDVPGLYSTAIVQCKMLRTQPPSEEHISQTLLVPFMRIPRRTLILPERGHPQFEEENGQTYRRERDFQGLNFISSFILA